jgi:hypothetical protein
MHSDQRRRKCLGIMQDNPRHPYILSTIIIVINVRVETTILSLFDSHVGIRVIKGEKRRGIVREIEKKGKGEIWSHF